MTSLLILALAPGVAIVLFMYSKDRYNREPVKYLLFSFMLGILCIVPAAAFQVYARPFLSHSISNPVGYYAFFAWGIVAFSEESCKFLALRYYAYRKLSFDEPFDGIVYSVMIGMGFATLENIMYVSQYGIVTAILRMFLSVPAHGSFAVLMGYHTGLAKFEPARSVSHLVKGWALAVGFHGAFDFFLFLKESAEVTRYVSSALLTVGALLSYYIAIRMSLKAIRMHQNLSKSAFEKKETLL